VQSIAEINGGDGSLGGMSLAMIAYTAIMEERPAREIGLAFILLQLVNAPKYLLLLGG
jgi:hypothetical protein